MAQKQRPAQKKIEILEPAEPSVKLASAFYAGKFAPELSGELRSLAGKGKSIVKADIFSFLDWNRRQLGLWKSSVNDNLCFITLYDSLSSGDSVFRVVRVPPIDHIEILNEGTALAVGNDGMVIRSADGGYSWKEARLPAAGGLTDIISVNTDSGQLVYVTANAPSGQLYFSADQGNTWEKLTSYSLVSTIPAYYLTFTKNLMIGLFLVSLVLFFFLGGLRTVWKAEQKIRNETALFISSDNPTLVDELGFKDVKNAVLNIIKSAYVRPPVSIVLNGAWGSGKSSLMSQLKTKLESREEKKGYLCIWFNVWHFQTEEHMLTSLLSSISSELNRKSKWNFRFRLFWIRFTEMSFWQQFRMIFGILLFAPLGAFLLSSSKFLHQKLDYNIVFDETFAKMVQIVTHTFDGGKDIEFVATGASVLVYILGIIFLKKDWAPAGFNTFSEILPVHKLRSEISSKDTGFREKYKREFWNILRAAKGKRKLVIFIDDMDRIVGEKIKECLESINFIADTASKPVGGWVQRSIEDIEDMVRSGSETPLGEEEFQKKVYAELEGYNTAYNSIYFVMGMSTREVVLNLGHALGDKENPAMTGARFLSKMVDLVVQLPTLNEVKEVDIINLTDRDVS